MFIGAALARTIWSCDVRLVAQILFDPFMIGEFATVVEGNGMHAMRDVAPGFDDCVGYGDFRVVLYGSTDQLARFAFHDRDQGALMKRVC